MEKKECMCSILNPADGDVFMQFLLRVSLRWKISAMEKNCYYLSMIKKDVQTDATEYLGHWTIYTCTARMGIPFLEISNGFCILYVCILYVMFGLESPLECP